MGLNKLLARVKLVLRSEEEDTLESIRFSMSQESPNTCYLLVKQPQVVLSLKFTQAMLLLNIKKQNGDLMRSCYKRGGMYPIKCIPTSPILELHNLPK